MSARISREIAEAVVTDVAHADATTRRSLARRDVERYDQLTPAEADLLVRGQIEEWRRLRARGPVVL